MDIYGNSERGMLNSFFYEIFYHKNKIELIQKILSLIIFKDGKKDFQLTDVKIYIEQSLSDFGDSDAILLIDDNTNKYSIFIEAKVKTSQKKQWSIEDVINKYNNGVEIKKVNSSNLITQLIYKSWLIDALKKDNWEEILQKGIIRNLPTSKKTRKMGNNRVVREMINTIKDYSTLSYYVAIVPGISNYHLLYEQIDDNLNHIKENLGVISWENIYNFCDNNKLTNTIENFKFNKKQIY